MAKNTDFCFRESGSASCIHMVAQIIFNSNLRDVISSSHLCKHLHIHGAYNYIYVGMCVCMCICVHVEGICILENRRFQNL